MDCLVRNPDMERAAVSAGFVDILVGLIRDRTTSSKLRCVATRLLGIVTSHAKNVTPAQAVQATTVIVSALKTHYADAAEADACCSALRDLVQLKEPRVSGQRSRPCMFRQTRELQAAGRALAAHESFLPLSHSSRWRRCTPASSTTS